MEKNELIERMYLALMESGDLKIGVNACAQEIVNHLQHLEKVKAAVTRIEKAGK